VSIYVNTGRLGSGKTLLAVKRIRDYLLQGRRVATNLDLNLEAMLPMTHRTANVVRIPDKPTVADLDMLGQGSDKLDESSYGIIVLDELGAWLNSREWADKGRQAVIDWLIHSRKLRWDVLFICQSANMIDKQIRDSLLEYHVSCKRLDKIKIPFFGFIGRVLTFGLWDGRVGKIHLGVVVDVPNSTPQSPTVVDRWIYRGRDLYAAYNTEQRFTSNSQGAYSYLTPWHLFGHKIPKPKPLIARVLDALLPVGHARPNTHALKDKHPAVKTLQTLPRDLAWAAAVQMWRRADGIASAAMPRLAAFPPAKRG